MWPGGHLHKRGSHRKWRRATFVKLSDERLQEGCRACADSIRRSPPRIRYGLWDGEKKGTETLEWSLFSILPQIHRISTTSVLCPPPLCLVVSWGYTARTEYGYPIAVKCLTWVWNLEITAWTLSGPAELKGASRDSHSPSDHVQFSQADTSLNMAQVSSLDMCVLLDMCADLCVHVCVCVCVCVSSDLLHTEHQIPHSSCKVGPFFWALQFQRAVWVLRLGSMLGFECV